MKKYWEGSADRFVQLSDAILFGRFILPQFFRQDMEIFYSIVALLPLSEEAQAVIPLLSSFLRMAFAPEFSL